MHYISLIAKVMNHQYPRRNFLRHGFGPWLLLDPEEIEKWDSLALLVHPGGGGPAMNNRMANALHFLISSNKHKQARFVF